MANQPTGDCAKQFEQYKAELLEHMQIEQRFAASRFNHWLLPPLPDYRRLNELKRRFQDCMKAHDA